MCTKNTLINIKSYANLARCTGSAQADSGRPNHMKMPTSTWSSAEWTTMLGAPAKTGKVECLHHAKLRTSRLRGMRNTRLSCSNCFTYVNIIQIVISKQGTCLDFNFGKDDLSEAASMKSMWKCARLIVGSKETISLVWPPEPITTKAWTGDFRTPLNK